MTSSEATPGSDKKKSTPAFAVTFNSKSAFTVTVPVSDVSVRLFSLVKTIDDAVLASALPVYSVIAVGRPDP